MIPRNRTAAALLLGLALASASMVCEPVLAFVSP